MKKSELKQIIKEEVKRYHEIYQKACKKFKIDQVYDLTTNEDPKRRLEFIEYLDTQLGTKGPGDEPVYTTKNPKFIHIIGDKGSAKNRIKTDN